MQNTQILTNTDTSNYFYVMINILNTYYFAE